MRPQAARIEIAYRRECNSKIAMSAQRWLRHALSRSHVRGEQAITFRMPVIQYQPPVYGHGPVLRDGDYTLMWINGAKRV